MIVVWKLVKKAHFVNVDEMDLITDQYDTVLDSHEEHDGERGGDSEQPWRRVLPTTKAKS